ncbi:hypothetical protein AX16_001212 [Volvariella volvacea WC 439]|nr:hypothetical protein AX16_001212 [Volvariella volvacea WC 439]
MSAPDPSTLGIPNSPPEVLFHDSLNLIASTVITGVAYGIMFTLFLICFYFLRTQITKENKRRTLFYLTYTTTMFILGTLYVVSNASTTDMAYVKHRLYEGGPAAYALLIYSHPLTILGSSCWIIINWMTDALMLWRFLVLYRGTKYLPFLAAIPCLMYCGCLAFGFLTVIRSSLPNQSFWSKSAINVVLAYFSLSISLTITTTTLMLLRLFYFRHKLKGVLETRFGTQYTSIAAMLIESASLYAVFSLVFIILYARSNPVQWIFLASLSQVQIIAPLLIIFRVSQGKAWSRNTQGTLISSLAAARPSMRTASPSVDNSTGDASFLTINDSNAGVGGVPKPRAHSPGHRPSKLGVLLFSESDARVDV